MPPSPTTRASDPFTGIANTTLGHFTVTVDVVASPATAVFSLPNQRTQLFAGTLQSAASYESGAVAPGEAIVLYGSGIGPAKLVTPRVTPEGLLAKLLAATRVLFDGDPAPLVYVQSGSVCAIAPYAIAGRAQVQIQIEVQTLSLFR